MIDPCPSYIAPWYSWHLPVGLAAVVLAVVGFVPWILEKAGDSYERWAKRVGIPLIGALLFLEAWSIRWDGRQRDEDQKQTLCQQKATLQATQSTLTATNAVASTANKNLDKTNSILESAKRIDAGTQATFNQVTGNHQTCVLDFGMQTTGKTADGRTIYRMEVCNNGTLPLDYCYVLIQDASPISKPLSSEDALHRLNGIWGGQLGPLAPGKVRGQPNKTEGEFRDIFLPEGAYYIHIRTRNDRFYESLSLTVTGNVLEAPLRYDRKIEVKDDSGKVIYKSGTGSAPSKIEP